MKHGKFASLKWVKPKFPKVIRAALAALADTPTGRALRDAATTFGFPRAGKVTRTAQEQAVELLEAAAEVEQALLTQYLYAAYSIDPNGPAAGLRETVVQIAIEEMGHLITVQNLLLVLGADPWFNRENVPLSGKPAGEYPFPLQFEPFSKNSLAKYVTTESMPLDKINDPDLKKALKPIFDLVGEAAGAVQHVGLLYAKLFWMFQKDDAPSPYWPDLPVEGLPSDWHIPDKALKGLNDPRQVTADEFGVAAVTPSNPNPSGTGHDVYVIQIGARDEALFALAQIARQGEGYQAGFDSHFVRFHKAYDDFAATFPKGIRPVPVNPNTSPKKLPKPEAEASRITHPRALRWAKLFDIRYQLLLLELWLGVSTDRTVDVDGPLGRAGLFDAAIGEMTGRIRRIADELLPAMNLTEDVDEKRKAGAPFGLPNDALPATEKSVKARIKQLLSDAEGLAVEIENLPPPIGAQDPEAKVLKAMRKADQPLRDALAGA